MLNWKSIQKSNRDIDAESFTGTLTFLAFGLGIAMLPIWSQADKYPLVRRDSPLTYKGVPVVMYIIPLVLTVILAARLTRRVRNYCEYKGPILYSLFGYYILGIPLFLGFFQLGLVLNGVLANNPRHTFHTIVLGKTEASGNRPAYFLQLHDWRRTVEPVRVQVPKSRYDETKIGDSIDVTTHDGALGYEILDSRFCSC